MALTRPHPQTRVLWFSRHRHRWPPLRPPATSQSSPRIANDRPLFTRDVSLLNFKILPILHILLCLLPFSCIFIVFLSMCLIERLFMIPFGILLWLRSSLLYIRLTLGILSCCHLGSIPLVLVGSIKTSRFSIIFCE